MTSADAARGTSATPVFFLSDSTGISAETMGNALLIQFPQLRFDRRLIPFITTPEEARRVVEVLDRAAEGPITPIAFTTAATDEIREVLHTTTCPMIDFFELHISRVEEVFGVPAARVAAQLHGVGDVQRYNARMAAIEYSIEHDDGQSLRAMDKAEIVLIAPSRCGKTPTTMYLALQHGLFVANYPLVEEDLETTDLPAADPAPAGPGRSGWWRRRGGCRRSVSSVARTRGTPRSSSAPTSCVGPRRCMRPTGFR